MRWSVFLPSSPEQESTIFREKGCIHYHAVNGVEGKVGLNLGGAGCHPPDLAFLVTAMWNHALNIWERMRAEHLSYPTLTYEEVADELMWNHAPEYGATVRKCTVSVNH
jgi:hypothetical protein